jgi:Uma2 family endonuclease
MTDQARLHTVEEFEQFLAAPENRQRRFELIDGEMIEKAMPTLEHGISHSFKRVKRG